MPVLRLDTEPTVPVSKETTDTSIKDTEVNAVIDENTTADLVNSMDTKTKDKTIAVDGPLSGIYAQALNIAFARESMADGSIVRAVMINDLTEDADMDMYVYVTTPEEVEKEGVGAVFNKLRLALDKYKDSAPMVVLESSKNISSRVAALEDFIDTKAKLAFNRNIAISKIVSMLNG